MNSWLKGSYTSNTWGDFEMMFPQNVVPERGQPDMSIGFAVIVIIGSVAQFVSNNTEQKVYQSQGVTERFCIKSGRVRR